jgi:hypothetical protein
MPVSGCPETEHMLCQNKAGAKALMVWMRMIDSPILHLTTPFTEHSLCARAWGQVSEHSVNQTGKMIFSFSWQCILPERRKSNKYTNNKNMLSQSKKKMWLGGYRSLQRADTKEWQFNFCNEENSRCYKIGDRRWWLNVGSKVTGRIQILNGSVG